MYIINFENELDKFKKANQKTLGNISKVYILHKPSYLELLNNLLF